MTEEITDVDLVAAQLAHRRWGDAGRTGLTQDAVRLHGAALQCGITTEDPASGFPA